MVYLPDELWLHILSYVPPANIWTNCLLVNRQLHRLTEAYAKDELLPKFKFGLTSSLGSGSHHRWYDVWGTITFHRPKLQPCTQPCIGSAVNYVLFSEYSASPESLQERTLLKWRIMAASDYRPSARPREWKLQFGDDEVRIKSLTRLEFLAANESYGIWVDWREMLGRYWERKETTKR